MFLLHELIIQILLRLPVKSLILFKCVCKLWFSLISHDSHFANSHFQLNYATLNRRILLISTPTHESLSIDFEASLGDDSASLSIKLDSIFPDYFEIKGSCRGFLLFYGSLNIYLWNPSTGLHKQIPFSPFASNLNATFFYGFGYEDSTDDYLVVSMSQHRHSDDTSLHLDYFSFKADKWKQVDALHLPYANRHVFQDVSRAGFLYNGAIHWLAYCDQVQVIVAFNLMERKLWYMLLPHDFHGSSMLSDFWVYGEFLSVYTMDYNNERVEIWVTKEYGGNSSWTMILVIPLDPVPNVYYCRPLCCTKSGDIIGTDGSGLVKFDKNGQFLEQHSYPNYDYECGCQVTMYIDSLFSLPNVGDNQQA